jgi:hypothetical protein
VPIRSTLGRRPVPHREQGKMNEIQDQFDKLDRDLANLVRK